MFRQGRPRGHPAQLLQLAQRLTKIVEFGAAFVAQLTGGTAEVLTRLPDRTCGPPDRVGQPFRPEHHESDNDKQKHLPPPDVGEHGVSYPGPG